MSDQHPSALTAQSISMSYGSNQILENVSIDLKRGEVLGLLGPSGSGKTTLLRLIAGLLKPDRGSIEIAGRRVAAPAQGLMLPPEQRGLGMVFQDYALWPHMSVAKNVAFPLEMSGKKAADIKDRVAQALDRVGLLAMSDRRPSDLSGGQQQRVAIARAIVAEPPLVLFDEPLSNLDRELRETMVEEIADLVADLNLSAVYVTHDHGEALTLSNHVAVMRDGAIEQLATPTELVSEPKTAEVADFLRLGTILPVQFVESRWAISGSDVSLPASINAQEFVGSGKARILLPERALSIDKVGPNSLKSVVKRVQTHSAGYAITAEIAGAAQTVRLFSKTHFRSGDLLDLSFSSDDLRWFPASQ